MVKYFKFYPLFYEYDNNINTIVLLFENNMHFKIVGYFNGNNMQTLFDQKSMPIEILKLINFTKLFLTIAFMF